MITEINNFLGFNLGIALLVAGMILFYIMFGISQIMTKYCKFLGTGITISGITFLIGFVMTVLEALGI